MLLKFGVFSEAFWERVPAVVPRTILEKKETQKHVKTKNKWGREKYQNQKTKWDCKGVAARLSNIS